MGTEESGEVIRYAANPFKHGMATIKTKGVTLKEGTWFMVTVKEVGDTVELVLCLSFDPNGDKSLFEDEFPFEVRVSARTIFDNRPVDVMSYLTCPLSPVLSDFIPDVIEQIMRSEAELLLENGGFEVNAYLKLRDYEEMVSIDRDTATKYMKFERP